MLEDVLSFAEEVGEKLLRIREVMITIRDMFFMIIFLSYESEYRTV